MIKNATGLSDLTRMIQIGGEDSTQYSVCLFARLCATYQPYELRSELTPDEYKALVAIRRDRELWEIFVDQYDEHRKRWSDAHESDHSERTCEFVGNTDFQNRCRLAVD